MTLESHIEEGEGLLARTWKSFALRGVLGIAFGVIVLVWPAIGLTTLIALIAVLALCAGFTALYQAFETPIPAKRRAWLAVDGVLGIAVGIVVLAWPELSARGLLFAIAAWAVATGVLGLTFGAVALPLSRGRSLLLMLWGLASVAFGVIMFAKPGAGALALLALIAAFAIVTGVMHVAYALELRHVAGEAKRRLKPWAPNKPVPHA
jgi:uncharacterized membrane protein HdeD (DUF308 family)